MRQHLRKQLRMQMERVASGPSEQAVHDLRVAARRLAAVVEDHKARRRLRRIRRHAAAVRDRDVALRLLRLPASHPIAIYIRGQRDFAAAQLTAYLQRQLRHPLPQASGQRSPHSLQARAELFLAASPAQPHALRIAAKRLRYSIEARNPEGAAPWLIRLRRLQRQLGDWHDLQVAAALIAARPGAAALRRELESRAASHLARFEQQWPRLFGPRTRHRLLAWAKTAA